MTVEHHESINLELVDNRIEGHVPIHYLLSNYYWTRLDADHVILVGSHSLSVHKELHEHSKVVVLPYLHHRKTIREHYQQKDKMAHHNALATNLELNDDDTMQELIDAVVVKHGHVFAPKY